MKTFTFPVVLTITGWVSVEANSLEEARIKGAKMNGEGVDEASIQDPNYSSECSVEEIEEV